MLFKSRTHDRKIIKIANVEAKRRINYLKLTMPKRNIIAFPDKGEYNVWLNKATEINAFNFKIAVSDLIENTEFNNGFDLADYYFLAN